MGRSVSTHTHAVATVYLQPDFSQSDIDFAWSDFLEDLRDNVILPKYPTMTTADRWEGRENHVIADNYQIEISVSEYCGLVAVCLAPLDPYNPAHVAEAERRAAGFSKLITRMFKSCALSSLGRFSNGEQVFQKVC